MGTHWMQQVSVRKEFIVSAEDVSWQPSAENPVGNLLTQTLIRHGSANKVMLLIFNIHCGFPVQHAA